jgi:NADH:ubiquinone reductase (H+-translocating)
MPCPRVGFNRVSARRAVQHAPTRAFEGLAGKRDVHPGLLHTAPVNARASENVPHVVIVGGGFGGLETAKRLNRAPLEITLIDRSNHHLFQPLLYQVATAGLSPAEIASPIRSILRKQKNATVLLAEVVGVNLERRILRLAKSELPFVDIPYDFLVLAAGTQTNYFANDQWAPHAIGLKDIEDALEIRRRVLLAFEAAEREPDVERRRRLMTFVVIGGGPTGVELAGALAELARFVLARDFRHINPRSARVVLIEAQDRLLLGFPEPLAAKAHAQLERLGVQVMTDSPVSDITAHGVHIDDEFIPTATVLWGAGVRAVPLTSTLGVGLDRSGRVIVESDCSIPEYPNAFCIGDVAAFQQSGRPLPGLAPVALQQGRFVADAIRASLQARQRGAFRYRDRGMMATVGRHRAVARVGRFNLAGFFAWLAWLAVHLLWLIGYRNRLIVLIQWIWSYVGYRRGARLITGHRLLPGTPGADERVIRSTRRTGKLQSMTLERRGEGE